jgi:hypothetical protein
MGEARRRKLREDLGPKGRMVAPDAPEVRALLEKGQPVNVHLFGATAIYLIARSEPFDQFMRPERHALRLAFQMLDRIRTGEIEAWQCFLCDAWREGMPAVSVMAVIERALGDPNPDKPGIVAPICHACDSIIPEETTRKVQAVFRLCPVEAGHA